MGEMLRFLLRETPHTPPAHPDDDPVESTAERIRRVPGVKVMWWYGNGPFFACARHLGETQVTSARTLLDALVQLEEDVRSRNRSTLREAFRLD